MADLHRPDDVLLLGERAYRRIKRDIITCQLAPGEELSEADLALRVGLGKSPVRSALSRLVQEGLVEPLPRRGHRITRVTMQYVEDTFALRILIEAEAARLAAGRVDGGLLRSLDARCAGGYDHTDLSSIAEYLGTNSELHVAIARASGNHRLALTLHQLLEDMERIFHLTLRLRDARLDFRHDHLVLVEALEAGDAREASEIAKAQVLAGREMVVAGLQASKQLMSVSLVVPV